MKIGLLVPYLTLIPNNKLINNNNLRWAVGLHFTIADSLMSFDFTAKNYIRHAAMCELTMQGCLLLSVQIYTRHNNL